MQVLKVVLQSTKPARFVLLCNLVSKNQFCYGATFCGFRDNKLRILRHAFLFRLTIIIL